MTAACGILHALLNDWAASGEVREHVDGYVWAPALDPDVALLVGDAP